METRIEKRAGAWQRYGLGGLVVLLVAGAFYCSLVADPHMTKIIPGWIGKWADKHVILRTAVPFCGMAVLLGILKFRNGQSSEQQKKAWLLVIGLPSLFVTLCELAQIPLPKRSADIRDVVAGAAGAVVGGVFAWLMRYAAQSVLPKPVLFGTPVPGAKIETKSDDA